MSEEENKKEKSPTKIPPKNAIANARNQQTEENKKIKIKKKRLRSKIPFAKDYFTSESTMGKKQAQNNEEYLKNRGIRQQDIELVRISTEQEAGRLKSSLRLRFPVLMANLIKICLYKGEEKLACHLTNFYEIAIDEELLIRAVETKQFQWIKHVWVMKKNWLGVRNEPLSKKLSLANLFDFVKYCFEDEMQQKECAM